jgi:hypothetical protein
MILLGSISSIYGQVDRRIGNEQYKNEKPAKKVDVVETSVENLKKKLKLDGFQEAIARNLIKENQRKYTEIIESTQYSDVEKSNLLTELGDKFNAELIKNLKPEQVEAYNKLIAKKK